MRPPTALLRTWTALVLAMAAAWIGSGPSNARAEGTVTEGTTTALLQALLGGGTVRLTFTDTLTLEIPIVIAADTILEGAVDGDRLATLSGGAVRRPFHVLPGIRFEIRNCVIREGLSTNGGGLRNEGILIASNVVFAACKATGPAGASGKAGEDRFGVGGNGDGGKSGSPGLGGALCNSGDATLIDCIFTSNAAEGGRGGDGGDGGNGAWANGIGGDGAPGAVAYGGAIHGTAGSRLSVINTLFSNNTALAGDGGDGGSDSSFLGSGQGAPGAAAAGGAIHTEGWLWVVRSAFATNAVTAGKAAPAGAPSFNIGLNGPSGGHAWGGALASWSTGMVVNSTFVTNTVTGGEGGVGAAGQFTSGRGGSGGDGVGGAIHARGVLDLTHVTLAWNVVTGGVGGAGGSSSPRTDGSDGRSTGSGIEADGATVSLGNSIVVSPADRATLSGGVRDLGHNLFSDQGSGHTVAGSIYFADPGFSEFKVWTSGTTPGFLLQVGSPALDAGDPDRSTDDDQRGLARPAGLGPDIGAMETAASTFAIRGRVLAGSGEQGVPGVVVELGERRDTTDASGVFRFGSLPAGFYTVAIAGGGVGYVPRLVQIPLVADATNVVFRTIELVLAIHPEGPLPGPAVLIGSGIAGRTYQFEMSGDLRSWTPIGAAVADSAGRAVLRHDSGDARALVYRMAGE